MKRPFAKKTANIQNEETKKFVQLFKDLQEDSEKMSKQARKIKQILKSSKDVGDPKKIEDVANELLKKPSSFLDTYLNTLSTLTSIIQTLGIEGVATLLSKSIPLMKQALAKAKSLNITDEATITKFENLITKLETFDSTYDKGDDED